MWPDFTNNSRGLHRDFSWPDESVRMRAIHVSTLCSLFLFSLAGFGQETGLNEGRVTIPYPELKTLLDAVEAAAESKPEPVPPVDAALVGARYRLDFTSGQPSLTADFEIETFTDDWHSVPLFGGDLRPGTTTLAPGGATLICQDGTYALIAKGIGKFTAGVSLTLPSPDVWEKSEGILLEPATATMGEMRVDGLPPDRMIRVNGLKATPAPEGGWRFPLPAAKDAWKIVLEENTESVAKEIVPSPWVLHSQILVHYADGRLRYSARVQGQADTGSGLSMTLALPANAAAVSVEGEDLDDWKLEPRDNESRLLKLAWETRDVLDRSFLVHWEVPQSPLAEAWEIVPPRLRNPETIAADAPVAESRALVALVAVEGLELAHPSLQDRVESLRLPEWMREQLGDKDAASLEITGDAAVSLAANWLPRLETAQATVSTAGFQTRLVADGSCLVSAEFSVQHAAPIVWKLELPAVDEILACTINGKDARPIRRSETEIEFRLATPEAEGDGGPSTKVSLSYSLKTERLDPVSGRIALELPLTGLFIHRLTWDLTIPEGYEPTAVEGNVQLSPGASGQGSGAHLIHLEKELCQGERPAVEIHYQRTDLSAES